MYKICCEIDIESLKSVFNLTSKVIKRLKTESKTVLKSVIDFINLLDRYKLISSVLF